MNLDLIKRLVRFIITGIVEVMSLCVTIVLCILFFPSVLVWWAWSGREDEGFGGAVAIALLAGEMVAIFIAMLVVAT